MDWLTKFIMLFIVFLITSCNSKKIIIVSGDIYGDWLLTKKQIDYPLITFKPDSNATFLTRRDTIFFFGYHIDGDTLHLIDINDMQWKNKIIYLKGDSLILDGLVINKKKQVYVRKKSP